MKRERVHYFSMGPWPVFVGFTTSEDAYYRETRRLKVAEPTSFIKNTHSCATVHFFVSEGGTSTMIICAQPFRAKRSSREQYAALLAHEAVHVIQDMREQLGDLGCEAEAYLVQQIVQESLQIAWKAGRTRKMAA